MSALVQLFKGIAGEAGVEGAQSVIKGTPVKQPAPTVIEPEDALTKLVNPAVSDPKKQLREPLPEPEELVNPKDTLEPESSAGGAMEPPEPPQQKGGADIPDGDIERTAAELSGARFDPELQGGAAGPHTEQLNFETITDYDGIKAVEQKIASSIKLEVDEARRGVITNEQLNGLADDLGLQREVVEKILTREQGDVLNAESLLAARKMLQKSATRLKDLADLVASGNATDAQKLQFRQQMMFHQDYYKGFLGARAEAGRALNAFKIPVGTETATVNRMLEQSEAAHGISIKQAAEMIQTAENVTQLTALNNKLQRVGPTDVLYEVWINSILSGVRTQEVNLLSNAFFQVMNVTETAVAAQIGRLGNDPARAQVGEASAMVYGGLQAFQDAFKFWRQAVKTGQAADDVEKFENVVRRRAISSDNWKALQRDDPVTHALARVVDYFGAFIRLPTERGLTPMDELFKTIATRSKLSGLAYREAAAQAQQQGLDADQSAQLLADLLRNPTKAMVEQSADYAYESTFQKALSDGMRSLQKGAETLPGARWVVPFMKTLVNVFNETMIKRTPLATLSPQFYDDLKAGGARADLAKARLAMGSMTVMAIAAMAKGGHLTGGEASRGRGRTTAQAAGRQDYSVVFTNPMTGETTYQSYHRIEPLGMIIGATVDAIEIMERLEQRGEMDPDMEDRASDIVTAIVGGVAEATINKSFLTGVSDFFQFMSDPERYADSYMKGFPVSMVPYSSLRRDLTKVTDPHVKQAWTLMEKIHATVPGLSQNVPDRLDIMGRPRNHPEGSVIGPLSIMPDRTQTKDHVVQELWNLQERSDTVPIKLPPKNIEGMSLTSQEYHDYIFLSRRGVEIDGMTFHEALSEVMDSSLYVDAPLQDKVDMLQGVQRQFDKVARMELEDHNIEYAVRIANYRDNQEAKGEMQ